MKTVREFAVFGMSCAGCASRIESNLKATAGIKFANVNFATKTLSVDASLSESEIVSKVSELGYKLTPMQQGGDIENQEKSLQAKATWRVIVAFLLAIPVFVTAMFHLNFVGSAYFEFILTTIVIVFPARIFFINAWAALKNKDANMDTLVVMGIIASFGLSTWNLFFSGNHHMNLYFESVVSIVAFILFGKFLEEKVRFKASAALRELIALEPANAILCQNNSDESIFTDNENLKVIATKDIELENRVLVQVGKRFPADGHIVIGATSVDVSHLTGESMPRQSARGDLVLAGSINLSAPVEVRVSAVQEATELGKMLTLVKTCLGSKAPIQRVADRVAAVFVPVMLLIAVSVFIGWIIYDPQAIEHAVLAAVAVLVVACPCALGLATPMSILVATSEAAKLGILIKDAQSLEILQKASVIIFDKTGTLTNNIPSLIKEEWFDNNVQALGFSNELIYKIIMEIEKMSLHPLAKALIAANNHKVGTDVFTINEVIEAANSGISGTVMYKQKSYAVQIGKNTDVNSFAQSAVEVKINELPVAKFYFSYTLRADAANAINTLKKLKIKPYIASGDVESSVRKIAEELNIECFYGQTPLDKANLITKLKGEGHTVVMVGDGINDAPALAVASVGVAIGDGTDIAIKTAGITLRDGNISNLVLSIKVSKETFRNIKQNLFWAFFYNLVLIPVAALAYLTPMLASIAMACSSLFVVLNALRLRKFR